MDRVLRTRWHFRRQSKQLASRKGLRDPPHCSRELKIKSAERTRLACWRWRPRHRELLITLKGECFGEGAETSTRGRVRSPERVRSAARVSLRAFFEGSGFAAKMREGFTGEVQRAGQQNGIRFGTRQLQCFGKGWSDGVGE